MRRIMIPFFVAAVAILPSIAQTAAPVRNVTAQEPTAPPRSIPPIPADLAIRTAALRARLQPTVAAWVKQQAKIEAGRRAFDLNALRAAVRQRFAASLVQATGNRTAPLSTAQADSALDAMAVIVIMEMVNDGDADLNAMMQQAQAQTQAKQAARNLLNQLNQQIAAAGSAGGPCKSPFCQQLPSRLSALRSQVAAAWKNSQTTRTIYFQTLTPTRAPSLPSTPSGPITGAQLNGIRNQLQSTLDSGNEISEMTSMQLQMLMDARSKLLETASDMEKSMSDTDMAIVGNIKQ